MRANSAVGKEEALFQKKTCQKQSKTGLCSDQFSNKALVPLHSPHYLPEREEAKARVVPKKT